MTQIIAIDIHFLRQDLNIGGPENDHSVSTRANYKRQNMQSIEANSLFYQDDRAVYGTGGRKHPPISISSS